MLNNVNHGCFVGASLVNHLMYADDLVLLAPSAAVVFVAMYNYLYRIFICYIVFIAARCTHLPYPRTCADNVVSEMNICIIH